MEIKIPWGKQECGTLIWSLPRDASDASGGGSLVGEEWGCYQWYYWWKKSGKLTNWGKGSSSHYLQGLVHPRWLFGISSINSSCIKSFDLENCERSQAWFMFFLNVSSNIGGSLIAQINIPLSIFSFTRSYFHDFWDTWNGGLREAILRFQTHHLGWSLLEHDVWRFAAFLVG